jgi:phospholipase C
MDSRRDFLKKAAALSAGGAIPDVIARALAIDPAPGSTFLDAEHVVILMQENRSFDHCYGSLRGVRGFNDPRAVALPNGNPVWLQSNAAGETYPPFRVDLKGSSVTWMGCLPHDWPDQSLARNDGKHDRWLDNKKPVREAYAHLPLTMGFHTREDVPFYYALADAFTVCDHAFCSSLTATTPNRLHLWSGTIRAEPNVTSRVQIRNGDAEVHEGIRWTTFPERLEEHGISWRVYQNELWLNTGLDSEAGPWLGNFGDNPLEYFAQFGVRYARRHREYLAARVKELDAAVKKLRARPRPWTAEMEKELTDAEQSLEWHRKESARWTEENWAKLTERERELHRKAFTANEGDPDFRKLAVASYSDAGTTRRMKVPRGDVFHRFRADVNADKLPAVSWLVAPQMFSDHPDSPWYGAWYVAEALDILTSRPEVWKKTLFILCYDENDGYFDHIPPFVPPDPDKPGAGKASAGLKTELEFVRPPQEEQYRAGREEVATHTGPIGLGYRVPLVVASPWSRGGYVCSEVFDHTSILRLLETFLTNKTGKPVREANITPWRRAMCGDLTSAFRPAASAGAAGPGKVERDAFLGTIHQAQFKPPPTIPRPLTANEIAEARKSLRALAAMPHQEPGTRPACALPYELAVHGALTANRRAFAVTFAAGNAIFGDRAAGAPFHVYAPGRHRAADSSDFVSGRTWAYAVRAGDRLPDSWPLAGFPEEAYHLRVHGPNGFYREFRGSAADPAIGIALEPARNAGGLTGELVLVLTSAGPPDGLTVRLDDLGYGAAPQQITLTPGAAAVTRQVVPLQKSHGWYDLRVTVSGSPAFSQRFAGRLETGRETLTDPLMG